MDEFRHYLRITPRVPSRLLVDVIEEDFRIEKVPHLFGKDRAAVMQRLKDRYYRSSKQYTYHEIQSREKAGRRDDVVLISALTNIDLVRPWMDVLNAEDVPVCGIWSLPHVSKKVLRRIDARSGHVLLISQQVSSNVRQTYFHNGKLITSRSATINLEGDTYGRFISEEIDQTTRFLTNKRYIGFDEILHIHIIAPDEEHESIAQECASTPLREVTLHRLADIEKKVDTQGISGPYGNGIFAQLCMEDKHPRGHYGNSEDFAVCYQHRVAQTMQYSAVAMVIATMLYAMFLFIDMGRLETERAMLQQQAEKISYSYEQELLKLEPKLKYAQIMKSVVDTARHLDKSKATSPQAFFVELSEVINSRRLSLIRISEIEWYVSTTGADQDDFRNQLRAPPQLKQDSLVHNAIIKGHVPVNADNIRIAVNQINEFAHVLKQRPDVLNVRVNELPVDVRSSARLSMEAGSEREQVGPGAGAFKLTLSMKGAG